MTTEILLKTALEQEIAALLNYYHAPTTRYQHLAFSSKSLLVLDKLAQLLQSLFPSYSVWNGEQPDITQSPVAPCCRKQFLDQVFDSQHQGLIIQHPEYWLERWDILEKQAFWSALSESHGGHPIIVIFSEGNKFASINQQYFNPQPLASTAVTAWVSTKTRLV
ncbi:MAG: hypothetical protein D4R63_07730 [Methylococcaceae bacterium]|nr:MAG: hypothetical protein D4R63_07730 [Methylococcaceae bacterium]